MALSELQRAQIRFAHMDSLLLGYASLHGIQVVEGEAHRPPGWAAVLAKMGLGIAQSLHSLRLARDLFILRQDGSLANTVEEYEELGVFWEGIGGAWGGRFKDSKGRPKPDAVHFSLPWQGRK